MPVDQWPEFIYKELSNAHKWMNVKDINKVKRMQRKIKGLRGTTGKKVISGMNNIDVIEEEDPSVNEDGEQRKK